MMWARSQTRVSVASGMYVPVQPVWHCWSIALYQRTMRPGSGVSRDVPSAGAGNLCTRESVQPVWRQNAWLSIAQPERDQQGGVFHASGPAEAAHFVVVPTVPDALGWKYVDACFRSSQGDVAALAWQTH